MYRNHYQFYFFCPQIMKLLFLVLLLCFVSTQATLFRLKPDYDSRYFVNVTIFQFGKYVGLSGDLLFRQHEDHLDLRFKNEQMNDTETADRLLPKLRAIEQPVRVSFDRLDLIKINHKEGRDLWTFLFPFKLDAFKAQIEKGQSFEKVAIENCTFLYTVNLDNADYYELNMDTTSSNCGDMKTKTEYSSRQLIRREDFGIEKHHYRLKMREDEIILVNMTFEEFVKINN